MNVRILLIAALLIFTISACSSADSSNLANTPVNEASSSVTLEQSTLGDEDGMISIDITIDNQVFSAKFYDNESAQTIIGEMPFTLDMSDYASQEKVTVLPFALPSASAETPATINAGDIYLWSGDSLVLFYTTFSNSYSYVPVGYIVDTTEFVDVIGKGNATVSFQIE